MNLEEIALVLNLCCTKSSNFASNTTLTPVPIIKPAVSQTTTTTTITFKVMVVYNNNRDNFIEIYYLIYLTLHWPFLINLRLCSLSINSYEYSCHTIWAGLFTALFIWLIYGKVAQWLNFRAVNHDIMGSNPVETVNFFFFFCFHVFLLTHIFVDLFCIFSIFFTYLKSSQCTYI